MFVAYKTIKSPSYQCSWTSALHIHITRSRATKGGWKGYEAAFESCWFNTQWQATQDCIRQHKLRDPKIQSNSLIWFCETSSSSWRGNYWRQPCFSARPGVCVWREESVPTYRVCSSPGSQERKSVVVFSFPRVRQSSSNWWSNFQPGWWSHERWKCSLEPMCCCDKTRRSVHRQGTQSKPLMISIQKHNTARFSMQFPLRSFTGKETTFVMVIWRNVLKTCCKMLKLRVLSNEMNCRLVAKC